jgi:UDP-N-acetylmuramate--alanine ligase
VTVLRYHFSGVAGAGMGPLASLMRSRGHAVQGSDRAFDQGKKQEIEAPLRRLGIEIVPQDGRAITAAIDRVVYSAAVEADTPELRAAPASAPGRGARGGFAERRRRGHERQEHDRGHGRLAAS